ncbi:MAG TPA: malic enzyme-like NAD(P)-binding protein [Chloroflexota bacterium]|nr:malic enzyme-like NAD(P)-binding protein [Chloroflexota bacterium]
MSADVQTSPSYSITIRCALENRPGMLGRLTTAIGEEGGNIGAIDIAGSGPATLIRDITVNARDEAHADAIAARVNRIEGVKVVNVSDRTFLLHLGGKIEVTGKSPLKTRDDLSMAYTPGVARVSMAIARDPSKAWNLTIKRHTVAVVSDGSAVLGLGNIGPYGAMPVMEGKCMLFKEFGGLDAFPICLDTQDPEEIIETVARIAPAFGGVNLEDIAAPRCFVVEDALRERVDIPVFHDDQHGTAIVVLAALKNALKIVEKPIEDIRIIMLGAGAAGVACTRILLASGARDIILCDREGAIYRGRTAGMNPFKEQIATETNPSQLRGDANSLLAGADVLIGLSGPGLIKPESVKEMNADAIVFAMANPTPEVMPETIQDYARIIATGRSDYPNQINNVLAFPGVMRGALDCQARTVNEAMKLAAAEAIASVVTAEELNEDYIIPSVFNKRVATDVAEAVRNAAYASGVARRERRTVEEELSLALASR